LHLRCAPAQVQVYGGLLNQRTRTRRRAKRWFRYASEGYSTSVWPAG